MDSLCHFQRELLCPGQKEQHFPEAVKRNESKVRRFAESWNVHMASVAVTWENHNKRLAVQPGAKMEKG